MSAPAKKQQQKGGVAKKKATAPAAAKAQKSSKPSSRAAAPPRKQQRPASDEDDEDDDMDASSSDDEDDSDAEIGLTAEANIKATIKPIAAGAAAASSSEKKSSASAPQSKGKKRKAEKDADDDGEEDPDADKTAAEGAELIDVEFGIYDPKPIDYLTIKMMLKDYVVGSGAAKKRSKSGDDEEEADTSSSPESDFALHELCDAIVDQVAVGSTVKGEGTDEPFGFLTALSFAWQEQYGKNQDGGKVQWVSQLKKYLIQKAPANLKSVFEQVVNDKKTGLLVQGRLINAPPQIIPQLHASLQEDINWILSTEEHKLYGAQFQFNNVILIARKFKPAPGQVGKQRQDVLQPTQFAQPLGASSKKQKKKQKQSDGSAAAAGAEEYEWLRFEEELYAKAASHQYSFHCPFTTEDAAAGRQPQSCVVLIIPQSKIAGIVQELQMMAAMS